MVVFGDAAKSMLFISMTAHQNDVVVGKGSLVSPSGFLRLIRMHFFKFSCSHHLISTDLQRWSVILRTNDVSDDVVYRVTEGGGQVNGRVKQTITPNRAKLVFCMKPNVIVALFKRKALNK